MGDQIFTIRIAENNYVLNFTGDQIADAIRRMIEFDPTVIGMTRIESTKENPCDLDLLKSLDTYYILYTKNGPAELADTIGVTLRVCEINGTLHQVVHVSNDIYVRSLDPENGTFGEWDTFAYGTTIFDGNVTPISTEVGALWVDTSGTLPMLKRYNGVEWVQFSPVGPGEKSEFIKNNVLLTSNINVVPTGMKEYDRSKGHLLLAFINSTLMIESTDYEIMNDGVHIRKIGGSWTGTPNDPVHFSFVLLIPGVGIPSGENNNDDVDEEIDYIKDRMELLYSELLRVEKKVDGAATEEKFEELRRELELLNTKLTTSHDQLQIQIDQHTQSITNLLATVEELQAQVNKDETTIKTLTNAVNALNRQVNELRQLVESGGGTGGGGEIVTVIPDNVLWWLPEEGDPGVETVTLDDGTVQVFSTATDDPRERLVYYMPDEETEPDNGETGTI